MAVWRLLILVPLCSFFSFTIIKYKYAFDPQEKLLVYLNAYLFFIEYGNNSLFLSCPRFELGTLLNNERRLLNFSTTYYVCESHVACNRGIHHEFDDFVCQMWLLKVSMQIESKPMPNLHFCEQDVTWSFYSACLHPGLACLKFDPIRP